MNRVELVGRLTAKPELRYTNSQVPFTRFTVAVNRNFTNAQGQREADFINIVIWRKQAENVCNYLDKGSLVAIEGRLQTRTYVDKDGNKRYAMEVLADSVHFLETKAQAQARSQNSEINNFDNYSNDITPYNYQEYSDGVDVNEDPFADFGDSVSLDDADLD
ncbi:MAG: single-stranded DNA-binding protein [Mollicutes bacterium]|jgi:single-strand DNA-binding protein|nr:single-stranded DNA-binding protein [Mollicutes bacterium]